MRYSTIGSGSSVARRHASGSSRMTSSGSRPSGRRTTPTSVRRPRWRAALDLADERRQLRGTKGGRALPCRVDVVSQRDARRVARDELDLGRRECRAERADDVVEALLMCHQRVGVALDQDCHALLADGGLGAVDQVQRPALVEQRGRRRVEVLGSLVARVLALLLGADDAPAQAGRVARGVADREDDPAAEAIVRHRAGPGGA